MKSSYRTTDKGERNFFIPIIFHNLKNYDSHFIIKSFNNRLVRVDKKKFKNVSIIASSSEKFIAFDINYMRFIDSCQFLSASLDTLVKNLRKAGENNFVHTSRHMESNKYIFEKGVFPYENFTIYQNFRIHVYRQLKFFLLNQMTQEFPKPNIYKLKTCGQSSNVKHLKTTTIII